MLTACAVLLCICCKHSIQFQLQWKSEKLLLTPVPETVISIVQKRLLTKPPYCHVNIYLASNFYTNANDQKKRHFWPATFSPGYWWWDANATLLGCKAPHPVGWILSNIWSYWLLERCHTSDNHFWEAKSSLADGFAQVQARSLIN